MRRAVREALADLADGDLVLVACSGGADSLALASAAAFEAPRAGIADDLLTNTLLTAVQSIWLNKYDPKTKAVAEQFKAKQDAIAARDVKGAKDANPKVPKAVVVAEKGEDEAVDEIVGAKPKPRQPGQQKRKKKARR